MLDPTDLEKGDELICIDPDGYLKQNPMSAHFRGQVLSMPIIFNGIQESKGLILTNEPYLIPFDALKFFAKKSEDKQNQHDFYTVCTAAIKAWRDGVSASPWFDKKGDAAFIIIRKDIYDKTGDKFSCDETREALEFIQSLYKETFVIECEEDFEKIKIKAKGTLLNGNNFTVEGKTHSSAYGALSEIHVDFTNRKDRLSFLSVKGATVEQPK